MSMDELRPVNGMITYKRLLSYTLQYLPVFFVGIFGFFLYAITQVGAAEAFKFLLEAIESEDQQKRILLPVLIVSIALVRGIGSFIGTYAISYVSRKVVHTLRVEMFERLVTLPKTWINKQASGQLISTFTFNAERVSTASADAVTILIREGITIIGLLAYLFYQNWMLTVLFLVSAPFVGMIVKFTSSRFRAISKKIQESMGLLTQRVSDGIETLDTIKLYGAEEYEKKFFRKASDKNRQQNMKMIATKAASTPVVQFIVTFFLAILVWVALELIGGFEAKEFTAYLIATGLMFKPIKQLTNVNSQLQAGIAAAESIFIVIDADSEKDPGSYSPEKIEGEIEFKNVSFSYTAGERVLSDINFKIPAGSTVALVGKSGSGKTTIANLLPRFYDLETGSIFLDAVDIQEYKLAALRHHISSVSQDVVVFCGTFRENIAYGVADKAEESKVLAAAEAAHALEFINTYPQGLDSYVGESGNTLSGGQKQRIAIARAIFKESAVIILDEATSALDAESEFIVQKAMDDLMKDRTTIVIAHRLSTIENADIILVMDRGEIIEAGNHQELLDRQGYYSQLHSRNFELD